MPTINTEIIVVIISTFGSLFAAALLFFITKFYEIKTEWRKRKISSYENLFIAFSDMLADDTRKEANQLFSKTFNTIGLTASQDVLKALLEFHDYVNNNNNNNQKGPDRHDQLLTKLLIEVRKDIGLAKKDNECSFKFHLVGLRRKN